MRERERERESIRERERASISSTVRYRLNMQDKIVSFAWAIHQLV